MIINRSVEDDIVDRSGTGGDSDGDSQHSMKDVTVQVSVRFPTLSLSLSLPSLSHSPKEVKRPEDVQKSH